MTLRMKKYVKLLWPIASVLGNLLLAYVVYFIARVMFLLENLSLYPNLTGSHLFDLFKGGMMFDTSAVLYTNALWIVLVLFPLHIKETAAWHKTCRIIFVVINTLCLSINLGDAVYFRYSMRRTTTTIFQEFSNEGNIADILLNEAINHWYFFLLAAFTAWALWKLYVVPRLERSSIIWWHYDIAALLSLLAFAPFCVA